MKKFVSIVSLCCLALLPISALAAENIKVFDLRTAVTTSDFAKQQLQALKDDANYKKLVEAIQSLQIELTALEKKAETNGLTWSDKQKTDHRALLQQKLSRYNQLGSQEANARQSLLVSVEKQMTPTLEGIVNKIIEEEKVTLLLKANSVYFHNPESDITKQVIQRLNEVGAK